MTNLIVWDIEMVPDLKGFAVVNGHDGRGDDEIRAAMGDWTVTALGAPTSGTALTDPGRRHHGPALDIAGPAGQTTNR